MSRRIVVEALVVVVQLRAEELRDRLLRRRRRLVSGPLGSGAAPALPAAGVRVVLDARPLQEPDRAPLTAAYLDGLLGAFDADPLDGESFAFLLRSDLDDPTGRLCPTSTSSDDGSCRRPGSSGPGR